MVKMKTTAPVAELPQKQENGQETVTPSKETSPKAGARASSGSSATGSSATGSSAKRTKAKSASKASAKKAGKEAKSKEQALDFALDQIQRKCGQGSIMFLGADHKVDVATIPTGSPSLDVALGVGGVPRGRIVEIYGPESSGKTTLPLEIIANAQKSGGSAGFIDAEHALDPSYARKLGVNLDTLLVSQPDSGEQALEIAEMLVNSNALDVIVIDSVAALVPRAELEGDMGDAHVGLQARLMSQALRKLTGAVNKSKTCLIFINQIREKIGVMFGSPETTSGGRALKFYSSVRLDIRRIGAIKDGDTFRGNRTRVKVVKNKVAPPFKKCEFDILYNEGISKEGEIIDMGVELNLVEKSGAWYSYNGERIGQGRDNVREFLKEHTEVASAIEAAVRERVGLVVPPVIVEPEAPIEAEIAEA